MFLALFILALLTMSGSEVAQVITATGSLVGALAGAGALFVGMHNKKALEIGNEVIAKTAKTVDEVHRQTDGLTKQLIFAEKINSEAIGKAQGVAQEEARASGLKEGQQAITEAAKLQTGRKVRRHRAKKLKVN